MAEGFYVEIIRFFKYKFMIITKMLLNVSIKLFFWIHVITDDVQKIKI